MNIQDLLLNKDINPSERSTIYFNWTNWVHVLLPDEILTCQDVRNCVVLDMVETDGISILNNWNILSVVDSYINNIIDVNYSLWSLVVWGEAIDLTNFLGGLSITFKDQASNWFNILWNYDINVEWLDWLTTVIDSWTIYLLLPTPADRYFSDHLNDWPAPGQLPWDYLPFNHRLVLTRDGINHQAYRDVEQCCVHVLEFVDWKLTIDERESFVDLVTINTDNQELSLDWNMLSLSRRHWGANWVQIMDPDSVVDLTNINEHILNLSNHRYLHIKWSDWKANSSIDLLNVGPKTLRYNPDTYNIELYDDDWILVDTENIEEVNSQYLDRESWVLYLKSKIQNIISMVTWNKPVHFCENAMSCICSHKLTKSQREAIGLINPSQRVMPDRRYQRWRAQPTDRPDGWDAFFATNPSPCDVVHFVGSRFGVSTTNYITIEWDTYIDNRVWNWDTYNDNRVYYWDTNIWNINKTYINNYTINNYYITNNSYFYSSWWWWWWWNIYNLIQLWQSVVTRTKYWARIYNSGNRVMWRRSQNLDAWLSSWERACRYVPNMDYWDWREAIGWTLTPYNKMLYLDNFITPNSNRIKFVDWDELTLSDPILYTTTKSANNPNQWSNWMCSEFGSKTITIPFDWNYLVSLNAEVQVDHNVQAFRLSILKRQASNGNVYPLTDTKFGWDSSVGSGSVNDVVYPTTKEYTCSWDKLCSLKQWDVLFLWIRIATKVSRPYEIPQNVLNRQPNSLWVNGFGDYSYVFDPGQHWYSTCPYWWWSGYTPPTYSATFRYAWPTPSWTWQIYPSSFWSYSWSPAAYRTKNLLRPTPSAPDIWNRYYYSPFWWTSGANNYWYILGRWTPEISWNDGIQEYWNDDWVVTLLGPSNIQDPAWWAQGMTDPQWGSMLTVIYQNKDYLELSGLNAPDSAPAEPPLWSIDPNPY